MSPGKCRPSWDLLQGISTQRHQTDKISQKSGLLGENSTFLKLINQLELECSLAYTRQGKHTNSAGWMCFFVPIICKSLAGIWELKATSETALSIFTIGQVRKQGPRGERILQGRVTLLQTPRWQYCIPSDHQATSQGAGLVSYLSRFNECPLGTCMWLLKWITGRISWHRGEMKICFS